MSTASGRSRWRRRTIVVRTVAVSLAAAWLAGAVAGVARGQVPASNPAGQVEPVAAAEQGSGAAADESSMIIRRSRPANTANGPATSERADAASAGGGSWGYVQQVAFGLGIVLVLILVLRWVAQRLMGGGHLGPRGSGAIRILWRVPVAPKQQIMLVGVGKRLLVVANTGVQMNTLCEVADPNEVATLLGQAQQEKDGSISKTFAGLFRRAERGFEAVADSSAAAGPTPQSRQQQQMPLDADDEADEEAGDAVGNDAHVDPALGVTKQELRGLAEKVRGLARQFK